MELLGGNVEGRKVKEHLVFMILALDESSAVLVVLTSSVPVMVLVMLLVMGPLWAELHALQVA